MPSKSDIIHEQSAEQAPADYTARIAPDAPVVVGQHGTWNIVVTVGAQGIAIGGGVRIAPPHREKQRWDVGNVVATTIVPGTSMRVNVVNGYPLSYHHSQYPVIYAVLEGKPLHCGDTITVTLGHPGSYVSGFRQPAQVQDIISVDSVFEIGVDIEGNTDYSNPDYPVRGGGRHFALQQQPELVIHAGPPASLGVRVPAFKAESGPAQAYVHARDAFGNVIADFAGTLKLETVASADAALQSEASARTDNQGLAQTQIDVPVDRGIYLVRARDEKSGVIGKSWPIAPQFRPSGYNVYWGDIHNHTNLSGDGVRDIDDAYWYARHISGLDFVAVTDHEGGKDWQRSQACAKQHNAPGEFTTFLAYEYSKAGFSGHRNVYYLDDDMPCPTPDDPNEIWGKLPPGRALVIPHHPNTHSEGGTTFGRWQPTDWNVHHPDFQRHVEICQLRGSFEVEEIGAPVILGGNGSSARSALAKGLRLGFVGGTDNHRGHPGSRMDTMGGISYRLRPVGGITAVLAHECTRESLWEALLARRTYATTCEHILLDFTVNRGCIGSVIESAASYATHGAVIGNGDIERIDIIRDGQEVHTILGEGQMLEFDWTETPSNTPSYYYLRVLQADGNAAWSSPVWIE
jgi:hypothetical protein